ncbi:hypothetical protein DITRI_Ditri12bG0169200 [Diplodiscus trichospermus]
MKNLLCDEVWLSSQATPDLSHEREHCILKGYADSFYTTKEDSERALVICLEKEFSYLPEPGYLDYLQSNNLVFARYRAVRWLIKTCTRLNLSIGTVLNAANYLDRFLSISQCHGWKHWMVELLSIACLSIASKFNEISFPSLDELQVEDLEHSFQPRTIQQMELLLLQALKWRLSSTTTYSYIELITSNIIHLKYNLQKKLNNQVHMTLLKAVLDFKLLRYPPSVVAISALWCSLEELIPSSYNVHLTNVMNLINQDHEEDIIECHRIMTAWLIDPAFCYSLNASEHSHYYPSSPVTVLLMERIDINDCQVDLSLFRIPGLNYVNPESSRTKRMRDDEE